MNILAFSTWFPYPPDNGSKIRAYYLLKYLAEHHRVTLITFDSGNDATDDAIIHMRNLRIWPYVAAADPYIYAKKLPKIIQYASPIPVAFFPITRMQKISKEMIKREQWDVVVAFQTPVARYAAQVIRVPRVLDVDTALSYNLFERYLDQRGYLAKIRSWVSWQKAQRYETRLLRKFQVCTIVSTAELSHVQNQVRTTRGQVQVIPNGVDCDHNRKGLASPAPATIIFNGALTYSANYDAMRFFLADIYPLIKEKAPNVSLIITGSTKNVNLEDIQLDDSVHLSGYVEDIRPLVASSSVCVTPIRQGGGTRLKILEAMALGTPVVSTTKGAEGLDVVDGKHILIADDPAEFAERVFKVIERPALRQQISIKARYLVEHQYDWSRIGRQFVELVESAVDRQRQASDMP